MRVDIYEKIYLVTEQNIKLSKVHKQSFVCFVFRHKCISKNVILKSSQVTTEEKSAFINIMGVLFCFVLLGLGSWISYFH